MRTNFFQRALRALTVLVVSGASLASAPPAARAADTTPPVATFVDPATLTAPVTVNFSEDVHGVTTSSLVLRVNATTANLSASMSCSDVNGVAVDCATGNVRRAVVSHQDLLVPGQRYDVVVNPTGATTIVDTSGNAATTTTETFAGSPTEQESSLASTAVWNTVRASGALDGSYRTERVAGAVTSFSFTGPGVTWYATTGPSQGWAVVGIDGAEVAKVNGYAPAAHYQVIHRYLGLARTPHTITIRVLGSNGHAGGGSWVSIDAFKISSANLDGVNSWPLVTGVPSLHGMYRRTSTAGARIAFKFRARGIDWYTITGRDQGKASLYIDGVLKTTANNYATATKYGVRRSVTGLADRIHTLTIVVTSATGWVSIDAWSLKAPIVEFAKLGAWIDLFDFNENTDPSAMLDAMRTHGVKTLFLETARYNSMTSFGDTNTDETAAIGRWVEGAHARSMKVVGWYFPGYGNHLSTDLARTTAIVRFRSSSGQAFDGLAIDMEHGGGTSGNTFNTGLKTHLHDVRISIGSLYPIGAITPAPVAMTLSSTYSGYPWSSIATDADVVMPMGYWSYRRSSPSQCSSSVDTYCAYKYSKNNVTMARAFTKLPVHEIGGVAEYKLNGSWHTIPNSDVTDFVRGAREAAAYGGSFYDYRTTASSWWTALAGLNNL